MQKIVIKGMTAISMAALLFLNVPVPNVYTINSCALFAIVGSCYIFKKTPWNINTLKSINEGYFIIAFIICGTLACNVYMSWSQYYVVINLSERLGISNTRTVFALSVIGLICALPFTAFILKKLISSAKKYFNQLESTYRAHFQFSWKSSYIILFAIFVIAVLALLRANINYIDDMGRGIDGYRGWDNFSRFVSNELSSILFMNLTLSDISPLLQIIAMGEMAFAAVALLVIFFDRGGFFICELLAIIPIALNPYFMECISYKFDSPFMAMSVLTSILPFIYRRLKGLYFVTASAIGTVIMCTTYQASSGIYPMIAIMLVLKMWMEKKEVKEILRFILASVSGFAMGLVFFYLVIMIPVDTYVSNQLPSASQVFSTAICNLKHYYSLVNSDFAVMWKIMFILILFAFIYVVVFKSNQNKLLSFGVALCTLGVLGLVAFGLYPVLLAPSFETRAMYGFGILIALLSLNVVEGVRLSFYKTPALVLSWMFFIFSFIYGNAMNVQKNYTQFRIVQTITDLQDIEYLADDESTVIQIRGTIGKSSVLSTSLELYPVLDRLIPVTFRGDWKWGEYEFYNYYGLKNVTSDDSVELSALNLPLLKDTNYNTIYGDSQNILVILK